MKKEEIKFLDLERILLGDAPIAFLGEVVVRSVITYVVLLLVLKLLGKRMSGRLTNTEMSVMLMFGAVVSSGMQIPDRGVVESCFVLGLILILQRLYTLMIVRIRRSEKATLGTTSIIVKNGVLHHKFLEKELLSRSQVFRALRAKSILHLGELRRVYMETNGSFTLIKNKDEAPGLSIMPEEDEEINGLLLERTSTVICDNCGISLRPEKDVCPACKASGKAYAFKKRSNGKK